MIPNMVKMEKIDVQTTNCDARISSPFICDAITADDTATGEANKAIKPGIYAVSISNPGIRYATK